MHKQIFSEQLQRLIQQELSLVFGIKHSTNYNTYLAEIAKAIHEQHIPAQSHLKELIQKQIEKVKQARNPQELTTINCYHARPNTLTGPVFPLHTDKKPSGFFVSLKKVEAQQIVARLYDIRKTDITTYKITIPKQLYKRMIPDMNSELPFKENASTEHSFALRPTDYPYANELYTKGLITIQPVR